MKELNEVSVTVRVCGVSTVTSGVARLCEYVKLNVTAEKPLSPVRMKLLSSSAAFVRVMVLVAPRLYTRSLGCVTSDGVRVYPVIVTI